MQQPRLRVTNLNKSFTTPVLKGVDLTIKSGSIHGLVGENGAGKSTLTNILTGLLSMDSGTILLNGDPYQAMSMQQSIAAGLALSAQELSLIDTLSVAENILLKQLPSSIFGLDAKAIEQQANKLMQLVGLHNVKASTPVSRLTLAQKQQVELAKVFSHPAKLILLDEPTAALTSPQADTLHHIIRELADTGVSILYISHRLDDVLKVCDEVSVLRDGVLTLTKASVELTTDELVVEMSGGSLSTEATSKRTISKNIKLSVKGLTSEALPHAINIHCHEGEIVGIAGLAGSGRTELLRAIFGLDKRLSGKVKRFSFNARTSLNEKASLNEKILQGDVIESVKNGIGLLAEDRKKEGILLAQSIASNTTLASLKKVSSKRGIIAKSKEQSSVNAIIEKLSIKCTSLNQHIDRLSGGNQQKVLLGRWLHHGADILLLDEPTRGVDVASKAVIYQHLNELCKKGVAIIVVSSEIEELVTICDRIVVLSNRKLVREFQPSEFSIEDILSSAFSQYISAKTKVNHVN